MINPGAVKGRTSPPFPLVERAQEYIRAKGVRAQHIQGATCNWQSLEFIVPREEWEGGIGEISLKRWVGSRLQK